MLYLFHTIVNKVLFSLLAALKIIKFNSTIDLMPQKSNLPIKNSSGFMDNDGLFKEVKISETYPLSGTLQEKKNLRENFDVSFKTLIFAKLYEIKKGKLSENSKFHE